MKVYNSAEFSLESMVLDQIRELCFQELDNPLTTQLVPQDVGLVAPGDLSGRRLEALVQRLISLVDETTPQVDVLPLIPADQVVEPVQLIGHVPDVRHVCQWGEGGQDYTGSSVLQVSLELEQIVLHVDKVVPMQNVHYAYIDYDPIVNVGGLHDAVRRFRDCQAGNAKAALLN